MTAPRRAAGILAALLLVLALPAILYAHQSLRNSVPARDARLTTAPRQLQFAFNEAVDTAFTTIVLVAPAGDTVRLGPLEPAADDAKRLRVEVRGSLVAGAYRVYWVTIGSDGHPTRGDFGFTIVEGAAGLAPPAPDTGPGPRAGEAGATVVAPRQHEPPASHHPDERPGNAFDASSPTYIAVRWVTYLAMSLMIGALSFRFLVLGALERRHGARPPWIDQAGARAARLGMGSALVLVMAVMLRLWAQSAAMHGAGMAFDAERLTTMLRSTVWGWGWLLQLMASLVAVAGFARARAGARSGWIVAGAAVLVSSVTPALSGHAAASRLPALTIIADTAHVLGAGGWIGGLAAVMLAGVPAALAQGEEHGGSAVAALITAFSPTALAAAGLLALTGVAAAWIHLEVLSTLWTSAYGRVLLLKLFVLAFLAATGAFNWRRIKPRLGDAASADRLRRTTAVELGLAVTVLLVTAVLVATPIEPPTP